MTIIEMLERNAKELSGKTAIIFRGNTLNYGELNKSVNKIANSLIRMGLGKGDRVGVIMPRIPELIISFLAVGKAGGIAVPINYELNCEEISKITSKISPRFIFVHKNFLGLIKKIPLLETIVILVGEKDESCIGWDEFLKSGVNEKPSVNIDGEDIFYLNYTSGSTGNAKGALTSYNNIYFNTAASVKVLNLTPEDVHLCMFAPFAHPHEIFARPIQIGGTMVLLDKIYPKSIAELISSHRVNCMMGLVPMYESLLDVLEHKHYDLTSLRIPESGGMYTPSLLIERFKKKVGVPIVPVWGSTETTGIAIAASADGLTPAGSVGKPCFSYDVKIVDNEGMELPHGKTGEMLFRGPAVVTGYYEDDISTIDSFKNGWYYSGDMGRFDLEGNLYFVARKSGMMKIAGLKVYPLEIEQVLMEHPEIKEAVVVSVNDRLRGAVPKAIVVPRNGKNPDEESILSFCKKYLARYKLPKIIELRQSLPKMGSGKINRKVL